MSISIQGKVWAALLALAIAMALAGIVQAAEEPPYEADPVLSLLGNCETPAVDPIPDPSCPYPAPPGGPTARFEQPRPVAIDQYGDQYVVSWAGGDDSKGRVDVFDDEGKFITEFKVPAAKTAAVDSEGNLYLFKELGDVVLYEPTEYEPEEGKIAYGNAPVVISSGAFQGSVAVDSENDHVLVARDTISVYKSAAEGSELIETYAPAGLSWTEAMAVDAQRRRIYVSFCADENEECGIKVLDADNPAEVLKTIDGSTVPAGEFSTLSGRLPVAADEETGDFVIADPDAKMIYRFSEGYEFLSQQEFKDLVSGLQIAISNGTRAPAAPACGYPTNPVPPAGDACNRHYLFVTVFKSAGRLAAFKPSNQGIPVIESVEAAGIGETEAELKAKIDPRGLDTEYSFQITTQEAWEANGFNGATVIPGGTISATSLPSEVSAFATGLTPGQTYRFRAMAENDLGPAEEKGQNEAVFATYDDASISTGCPNEALRLGPSALLPDCRAYELVTPADTNGHAPRGTSVLGSVFSTLQASPSGGTVSFRIEGGALPGDPGVGGFNGGDPYLARRNVSGWGSELAGPTGAETTKSAPASVSPDQNYSFWRALGEGPLGSGGGIFNEYFRYPDGHSDLIGRGSEGTEPVASGKLITENATHVVFQSINLAPRKAIKLEPNAPPEGTTAVYDRTTDPVTGEEETHVVSLLPGDVTPNAGENANYLGASKDGEGIAFGISTSPFEVGMVYLRVGNETTYQVGKNVAFAGISEGGERIFYLEGGNLKALDTTEGSPGEVLNFTTTGKVTPVNVSADGSRAYFVSPDVLGGANPAGDIAQKGKQNLYLSEEGAISFVATVTERDVKGEKPPLEANLTDGLGLWTEVAASQPAKDPSRLNPDGSVLLFQSRAEITGYPESEFPQIYRFDAGAGELQCISCIPTKTPAAGGARLESYTFDTISDPEPFSPYGFVPNLTPDGRRAFFDSEEALVSGDTDGVTDVYEWEAQGVGSCTRAGGCVYLISSGQSEVANFLYGHSTSGDDVFFTTGDRLTGHDSAGGAISIYDAKVNGGFPEPTTDPCADSNCPPPLSPPPVLPTPAAPARGADDQVKPKPKHCPKNKRKVKKNGKVRCVKKKQHKAKGAKAKHRAGADRGAGK